jgi:hypothetical protein
MAIQSVNTDAKKTRMPVNWFEVMLYTFAVSKGWYLVTGIVCYGSGISEDLCSHQCSAQLDLHVGVDLREHQDEDRVLQLLLFLHLVERLLDRFDVQEIDLAHLQVDVLGR